MPPPQFARQVRQLRQEGKSIRAIAADLGVHKGKVERALKAPAARFPEPAPAAGPLHSLAGISEGVFVGRQAEVAELTAALDDVMAGRGRLALLGGEPGIGKTRLCQQVATRAAARGAQVVWGRCHASQGAPPYWPWIQVIRGVLRGGDTQELLALMGDGAREIAEIVPEIKKWWPGLEPPVPLEPAQSRFRLFDSIATFLKEASSTRPLVLVLDNLHWADHPSLELLEFLSQEMDASRLLVLGTYRDTEVVWGHPFTQTLEELATQPLLHRLALPGLSQAEIRGFIEAALGSVPPAEFVETVHSRTQGNPLFITEIVRLVAQEDGLTGDTALTQTSGGVDRRQRWLVRIPDRVHDAMKRRLDRLSQRCHEALTRGSVIGREFSLGVLERLMEGLSPDEVLEAVEEALPSRVIEEVAGAVGRYQFAHVLFQETLIRELSGTRRARMHARIGEVLEELYRYDIYSHAAELAYHFTESEPVVGPGKMVKYSLITGEQALAAYAHGEALAHFQRALAAKEGQPADGETAALLYGLGRAQAATLPKYQLSEAVATLSRAFDYYSSQGDVDRAVSVAGYPIIDPGLRGLKQLCARALQLVAPSSHEAGRLLPIYGRALGVEDGDYAAAHDAFDRALAIAMRDRDSVLEMWTVAWAGGVDGLHLASGGELENGLRAVALAEEVGDPSAEWMGHIWAARALLESGRPAESSPHAQAALTLSETMRDHAKICFAAQRATLLAMFEGDWTQARAFSDQGLSAEPQDMRLLSFRTIMEHQIGAVSLGREYVARLLEATGAVAPWQPNDLAYAALALSTVGRITQNGADLELAKTVAETVARSEGSIPRFLRIAQSALAIVAVCQGDTRAAESQYAALVSRQGSIVDIVLVDRVLGLLARTMGRREDALRHFERAVVYCRSTGFGPELAWTYHDMAETLSAQRGAVQREKAKIHLDEAERIARAHGMKPLLRLIAALRVKLASQIGRPANYPAGLTEREVEVLRLVASGRSNPQIAQELFLSPNTVADHVKNILIKTNTVNRAEAAAFAMRYGLAGEPGQTR